MSEDRHKRGIHERYRQDSLTAHERLRGRKTDPVSRRSFLQNTGLAAMSTALAPSLPLAAFMSAGRIPAAFANAAAPFSIAGKEGLRILNDRPINAETPAHLLDDALTPARYFFIRNNGHPPSLDSLGNAEHWKLTIAGESCANPATFTLASLKTSFEHYSYALTLECGGNGRSEFNPPARGNQWTSGAVGCARWTGVRLKDVLAHCGIEDDAVYVGYYGADTHLSGNPEKQAISRGVPIARALENESLIAWAFNDAAIPYQNGYPLRLVVGGMPASTCGKWLTKIVIRNRIHDGAKMAAPSYRIPCAPVEPGSEVADEDMCIIESMPVKSLVTFPESGSAHRLQEPFACRGQAWAGDLSVARVHVSIDFGATWLPARVQAPVNRLAWQRWQARFSFPQAGYYEVWARATDTNGVSQPMVLPGWNPKGYLNNACHRIAVQVV